MFDDKRSKKVLLIAHCILNQNAKIDQCAYYPGVIREVSQTLMDSGVGILQMPCPELLCLGLDRQVEPGLQPSVESEDTRVAQRMSEDQARNICRQIAVDLVYQLVEYQKNEFTLVGAIGINGSPTCGVETTWINDQETQGSGVFIQILDEECQKRGFSLAMRGIKAYEPQRATATVVTLLENIISPGEAQVH